MVTIVVRKTLWQGQDILIIEGEETVSVNVARTLKPMVQSLRGATLSYRVKKGMVSPMRLP